MLSLFLKFVKYYGKNRKIKLFLFLLISIVAGFLEFIGIGLIYPFLMMLINPQMAVQNNIYKSFSRIVCIEDISINLVIIAILVASMFFLKNILMIFCIYWQHKFVVNWKIDINKNLMKYYLYVPYRDIMQVPLSEKTYNISVLSAQALEVFVGRFLILTTNLIILFLILSLLFLKFFTIAVFTITFVCVSMLGLNKFFKKRTSILAPKLLEASIENNNQTMENCSNLKEVRIFSAEKYFLKKFISTQNTLGEVSFKSAFLSGLPPFIVEMILVLTLIILAVVITYQSHGDYSKIVASYGLILVVLFRIAPILNKIQTSLNNINATKKVLSKMNELYEQNDFSQIENIEGSKKAEYEGLEYKSSLRVEGLNFEYELNKPIIKNASFEIKKGEFIGIIGLSGAGKTTLADILMGLLPVNSGKIYLDDEEITSKNGAVFRSIIGYVPQEMHILNDSFKKNVAWGQTEESIDESRVKESLLSSQLLEVVEEKGGINAKVNGLSQGQMQRLLIARALYKRSQIIIFDEATSSLDVETENEIIQMLTKLKGNKTIIAIAHRLITLKNCDKLIYLKEGKIVDIGTFAELSSKYEDFEKLIKLSKF